MRAFPTSTNAKEHVLLALDSDRTGRDDVEIAGVGVSPRVPAGRRFICVKPRETDVQRMLYSIL